MPRPEIIVIGKHPITIPAEFQFYKPQRGVRFPREFERESLPGLQKSLSKAHDNLTLQVGINTRLYVGLTKANNTIGWQTIWIRILAGAITVQFGLIVCLISEFLHRFGR